MRSTHDFPPRERIGLLDSAARRTISGISARRVCREARPFGAVVDLALPSVVSAIMKFPRLEGLAIT